MTLHRRVHYSATCEGCGDEAQDVKVETGWFRVMGMSDFAAVLRRLGWQTGTQVGGSKKRKPNLCPDCVAKAKEEQG